MTFEEAMLNTLPEHKKLLVEMINVLDTLKAIDVGMVDHLLNMASLARAFVEPEMQGAIDSMMTDLKLVRIFSEQARKYDQSDKAVAAFDHFAGKEAKNE